jgi:hypothetical protein
MKPEMRQHLAQLSFEEKIRKVGELIMLSRKIKAPRDAEKSISYRGSLKGTDAMDVFISERKRERES